jgi:hypothetical protein
MSNVVELAAYKPHTSGQCRCVECQYTWVGVVPVGVRYFECPKCDAFKGIRDGFVDPPGERAACVKCENQLFFIGRTNEMCAVCGDERKP